MKKFSKGLMTDSKNPKVNLAGIYLPKETLEHDDRIEMKYEKFETSISVPAHIHSQSKTWVIVIKGKMTFRLDGEVLEINSGEYLIFESGVVEEVVEVEPRTESISMHVPSIEGGDKLNL